MVGVVRREFADLVAVLVDAALHRSGQVMSSGNGGEAPGATRATRTSDASGYTASTSTTSPCGDHQELAGLVRVVSHDYLSGGLGYGSDAEPHTATGGATVVRA